MQNVESVIRQSQGALREKLSRLLDGGMSEDQYVRYLSMQYHLTKGVQRHFIVASSHSDFATRPQLREYLFDIGVEEELHFEIAQRDIESLGRTVLPPSLDTKLWHLYFGSVLMDRPLVRIGAHCVLENIAGGSEGIVKQMLTAAPYIRKDSSRFVLMHLHADAPHGDRILRVLNDADLTEAHRTDLAEGAEAGATMYLRMIDWAIGPAETSESRTEPARATA